jgi:hypothetical protein
LLVPSAFTGHPHTPSIDVHSANVCDVHPNVHLPYRSTHQLADVCVA